VQLRKITAIFTPFNVIQGHRYWYMLPMAGLPATYTKPISE